MPQPFDSTTPPPVAVVAAYFGGWKDPPEASATQYLPSPWGRNPANNIYLSDYPERYPTYGAVDEDSQVVIDQHLADAATAGITAFAVNWYRDEYLSYPATRMAASTSTSPVKWCIQWSNHYTRMSATACQKPWVFEGVRLAALRMSGSRYWRKSNRPVFVIFTAVHLDDTIRVSGGQLISYTPTQAERAALVRDIRNVIGNVLAGDSTGGISGSTVSVSANAGPYLVLMTSDADWVRTVGVDATTDYNVQSGSFSGVDRLTRSFAEVQQACRQNWAYNNTLAATWGKPHWPTVMAGWDARAWGGTAADPLHDNCTPTDAEFAAHMASARQFASTPSADGTVFLYAWNEFGEGGYVQPTVGTGSGRLNAIAAATR